MQIVLIAIGGFAVFTWALYLFAGWWLGARARRAEYKADRILQRALRRTDLVQTVGAGVVAIAFVTFSYRMSPYVASLLAYLAPPVWLWTLVAGSSWLERTARGVDVPLLRFYRFNLFSAFLQYGQRIPFYSAALTAPVLAASAESLVLALALHFLLAVAVGLAFRAVVVHWLVSVLPFPDRELTTEIREKAVSLSIRFRGIRLVATERGQSVNALAATSSRVIYVAEGMWMGLEHAEVKAVLLHELGHLGQPVTNLFGNVAVLGWPAAVLAFRHIEATAVGAGEFALQVGLLAALVVLGSAIARRVRNGSELRADAFAERHGVAGALRAALVKMYARSMSAHTGRKRRRYAHPGLRDRLGALEASVAREG